MYRIERQAISALIDIGSDLASVAIALSMVAAALFVGHKVAGKMDSAILGWVAGLAVYIASASVLHPTNKELHREACLPDDEYSFCVMGGRLGD